MITAEQLAAIMPQAGAKGRALLGAINAGMEEFGISTPQRKAAFLAQIAHESGQMRWLEEIASGSAYEGRRDLGNTQPGDGKRFKGRGLIQITGRANYAAASKALFGDDRLLCQPETLALPESAVRSACWWR